MKRIRYTAQHRAKVVNAFRQSGMTRRQFAERHGVKVGTLSGWLHKYGKNDVRFVRVESPRPEQETVRNSPVAATLVFGDRLHVHVDELPPPSYLAELATCLLPC